MAIIDKVAPLNEIRYEWTVKDVFKAFAMLELKATVEDYMTDYYSKQVKDKVK